MRNESIILPALFSMTVLNSVCISVGCTDFDELVSLCDSVWFVLIAFEAGQLDEDGLGRLGDVDDVPAFSCAADANSVVAERTFSTMDGVTCCGAFVCVFRTLLGTAGTLNNGAPFCWTVLSPDSSSFSPCFRFRDVLDALDALDDGAMNSPRVPANQNQIFVNFNWKNQRKKIQFPPDFGTEVSFHAFIDASIDLSTSTCTDCRR